GLHRRPALLRLRPRPARGGSWHRHRPGRRPLAHRGVRLQRDRRSRPGRPRGHPGLDLHRDGRPRSLPDGRKPPAFPGLSAARADQGPRMTAPGGFTAEVAERASTLTFDELPADVVEVAGQCLLDWFGVTVAGSQEPATGIALAAFEPSATGL